jgi:hypothetical protein
MDLNTIFNRLWSDYAARTPSAKKIVDLFAREGEAIVNDHIAFRTLDYPGIGIDVIARPFLQNGYVPGGEYEFAEGAFGIPSCYYEFAQRFPMPDGKLFNGFVTRSANKIFESTDYYQ